MRPTYRLPAALALALALVALAPGTAHATGFFIPFWGYNFGGDSSAYCESLTSCQDKRTNFGADVGSMGSVFGFEEDIAWAKDFFGSTPNTDNSVFTLMSNLLVGVGKGPIQPYGLIGIGLVRAHVSTTGGAFGIVTGNNTLGWDVGGGLNVYFSTHVGVRGDIRRMKTFSDLSLVIFTPQPLEFWRFALGAAFRW